MAVSKRFPGKNPFKILRQLVFQEGVNIETLSANRTLDRSDGHFQRLDPAGARNVVLPAEESSNGLWFAIYNNATAGSGEVITVQNDASATVVTLEEGQSAIVACDGSAWGSLVATGAGELVARGSIATGDVQTMNATPVEVIAAPGAGFYIDVISCHWWLDFATTAYDGAGAGEDLVLKYTNASGAAVVEAVDHSGFGDASADAHAIVQPVSVVPVANAAIVAHILVGEWYAAAGDSPVSYEIRYRIRPLDFATS